MHNRTLNKVSAAKIEAQVGLFSFQLTQEPFSNNSVPNTNIEHIENIKFLRKKTVLKKVDLVEDVENLNLLKL